MYIAIRTLLLEQEIDEIRACTTAVELRPVIKRLLHSDRHKIGAIYAELSDHRRPGYRQRKLLSELTVIAGNLARVHPDQLRKYLDVSLRQSDRVTRLADFYALLTVGRVKRPRERRGVRRPLARSHR